MRVREREKVIEIENETDREAVYHVNCVRSSMPNSMNI